MQKLTHEAVNKLIQTSFSPAVTLYIPLETSLSSPHITENQIRFKNLIHMAVDELKARGDTSKLADELRQKLDDVHDDLGFWKDAGRGILLCASPGMQEMYELPVDTEEYAAVDESFHLAPILALLGDERPFYVLALAQQNPKLYTGNMYGLTAVDIGLPTSLRQGLGIDEPNQKSENQGSANGSSQNTGGYNGRGGSRNPMDNDRMKFFHLVDAQLHAKADRTLPLLLAGIESEIAEFRDISKYPHLMKGSIAGNHTETRPGELFDKAFAVVRSELIQPEHDAVREEYQRLAGASPERVAGDHAGIVAAADQGRVDKLLAGLGRVTTDTVQDRVASVFRISFPEAKLSKKLNNLAMKVWAQSGKIISLLPHEMPNGAPMVARLRY
jgi:hypothetical protein